MKNRILKSYFLRPFGEGSPLVGNPESSLGFSFIEIVIVFAISAFIGTMGIASLSSYSNSQQVVSATTDLKTLFTIARTRALSQVKPAECGTNLTDSSQDSTLLGYEVDFCAGAQLGKPSACGQRTDYEVNALCANGVGYIRVESKSYSSSLTITTTKRSYFFPVLKTSVNNPGTVTVSGFGKSKTITITSLGIIQ